MSTSVITQLSERGLVKPPKFVTPHVHYESEVGSVAYGVSQQSSDIDIYGFCVPPKAMVFPHLAGDIPGFGRQKQRFDQYQKHGIQDTERACVWDLTIYSIVRFFMLCMENNPNMIESIYTPERCVRTCSPVAKMVRDRRQIFLHKGAWHKFKGFAYSQIHKMKNKNPEGKRVQLIETYGFDVKFAYHAVRLMDEAEQILSTGDLDLEQGRDRLIAIRKGEWTQQQVEDYFDNKEKELQELYERSTLQHSPDEAKIRELLLECMEEAWGDLDGIFGG